MDRHLSTGRLGFLFFLLTLTCLLTLGIRITPVAANPNVNLNLVLNGNQVNPAVATYVDSNGRTMVPVRFIMEYMGARVDWLQSQQGIVIRRGATTIKMWIGKRQAYVVEQSIMLDTVPVLKNKTAFISNPTEEKLLVDPAFQARAAEGILNGISAYFAGN